MKMKWIIECSVVQEQCKNGRVHAVLLSIAVVNKVGFVHYCRYFTWNKKGTWSETLLAALPHRRYAQNDNTIMFCFSIHFQFAFKSPLKVVSLIPHSIRIGSMRIQCGLINANQFGFNAHYFPRVDRPVDNPSIYIKFLKQNAF